MTTQEDGTYWREVLDGSGLTSIPRWTLDPVPGTAETVVALPAAEVAAVHRAAAEMSVPVRTVVLAAHAAVLAALSGERELVTGYAALTARPLPCRLSTGATTWRALVEETHRAESDVLAHADVAPARVEELARELGRSGPLFETVFHADGLGDPVEEALLEIGCGAGTSGLALHLRHRTDVLDVESAARIAGYHRTALAALAAGPDLAHRSCSLLSEDELRHQLEDLVGPHRELPDRRVHELFEDRVRRHPEAIAAVHGTEHWTYRELNARANQVGRALIARGVRREDVVAVVMERSLGWMAAVLAIWKCGGVYLPLEPHFPADRIARALSRAGCELVLTERGSTTTLARALEKLPATRTLHVDAAWGEGHGSDDLGIAVSAGQLAYVLFTSGSTGEPKGAMCEHAGMLNHLYAKLQDLEVADGEVVAQNGPQCFDVSVWQLVGALVIGGRTLIIDQQTILDVERFVDTLVDGRVAVLQVVPSYLDVIVSYLEQHPRALPDLHTVCPTGDFLKKELVQRWFAVQPGITLVNTYGLTETSDDAVHEIMDGVPEADRVPLGRPIHNVDVYVVDEHLAPVPLGAPGLIVFSGVCVGRGYVNDPERTRQMFTTDPHREGQRLCRTGDYGRWMPDGKLDFLGRRDNQVKIRGFRIEVGEIENALTQLPGVRDGAVVVAERPDRTRYLAAFCAGPRPLPADVLRARLAERLPEYMVPALVHWREALPLTPNGKIDRAALTAAAAAAADLDERTAPSTPTELRLAAAWAAVLGIPVDHVGRTDHFFDLGGTSLSAVKLAVTLQRAVSPGDLLRFPVLADLAAHVDERSVVPVS